MLSITPSFTFRDGVFTEVIGKTNQASVHIIGLNYFFTCSQKTNE